MRLIALATIVLLSSCGDSDVAPRGELLSGLGAQQDLNAASNAMQDEIGVNDAYPPSEVTILACEHFTIRNLQSGFLGFFDEHGNQFFETGPSALSFYSAPSTYSGQKNCDVPIGVKQGGKYGIIMPDGSLFAGRLFEDSYGLYQNTLAYSERGKWGLIEGDGTVIVAPVFDEIAWHGNGLFLAKIGGSGYFMDRLGRMTPLEASKDYLPKYDTLLPPREEYTSCPDDTRRTTREGKWGIIDKSGNIVVPIQFLAIGCLHESGYFAPDEPNRQWCRYDREGNITTFCMPSFYIGSPSRFRPKKYLDDDFDNSVKWSQMYLEYGAGLRDEPPLLIGDGEMAHGEMVASPFVRERIEPNWFE